MLFLFFLSSPSEGIAQGRVQQRRGMPADAGQAAEGGGVATHFGTCFVLAVPRTPLATQVRTSPLSSCEKLLKIVVWGGGKTREGGLLLLDCLRSHCSDLYHTLNEKVTTFHLEFVKHCLSNPQVRFDIKT
jgi:hypothetical protein